MILIIVKSFWFTKQNSIMGFPIDEVKPIVKEIANRKKTVRRLKYVKVELI